MHEGSKVQGRNKDTGGFGFGTSKTTTGPSNILVASYSYSAGLVVEDTADLEGTFDNEWNAGVDCLCFFGRKMALQMLEFNGSAVAIIPVGQNCLKDDADFGVVM